MNLIEKIKSMDKSKVDEILEIHQKIKTKNELISLLELFDAIDVSKAIVKVPLANISSFEENEVVPKLSIPLKKHTNKEQIWIK